MRIMLEKMRGVLDHKEQVGQAAGHIEVLRRELIAMAGSIATARREIAALKPPDADSGSNKILTATNELDAIVTSTERASFDILNSAERLLDLSGQLRDKGAPPDLCNQIENEVTNIFTACSFQDLTGQRTSKVVNALRYIEQRVNAMIGIWGVEEGGAAPTGSDYDPNDTRPDAHLLSGPQLEGHGVSQSDVDAMFAEFDQPKPALPPVTPPSRPAETAPPAPVAESPPPPPAPAPKPPPPPPKPVVAAQPPPSPPKPAPAADTPGKPALDQSAIDALFG
jgi:chemotaxis regulatin CheY-phosphate phosphatase CheZ